MANQCNQEIIKAYLEKEHLTFQLDEEIGIFRLSIPGPHCLHQVVIHLIPERDTIIFLLVHHLRVEEDHPRIMEVLKALCDLNYTLMVGAYEWDIRDGEVRYKVGARLDENGLTYEQFRSYLFLMLITADRNYPIFQKIIWGGKTYKEALEESMMEEKKTEATIPEKI